MRYWMIIAMLLVCSKASSQSYALDGTFGDEGVVRDLIVSLPRSFQALDVQADGKIVVGGWGPTATGFGTYSCLLARYSDAGNRDLSFGTGGYVLYDYDTTTDEQGYDLAVLPDNSILALVGLTDTGGLGSRYGAVVSFKANGSVNTSFANAGVQLISSTTGDYLPRDLELSPDSKVLISGIIYDSFHEGIFIARLNMDGSIDSSFSSDGIIEIYESEEFHYGEMLVQPDGKVLLVGHTGESGDGDQCLWRFNSDGSTDNSFSTDGYVQTDYLGESNRGMRLVIQADGKIVVGSELFRFSPSATVLLLSRYNADGSLDLSFGSDGFTEESVYSWDYFESLVITADDKILAFGKTLDGSYRYFINRFNSNGSLDLTLNSSGFIEAPMASIICQGLLLSDGKLVLCGNDNSSARLMLVRYKEAPTLVQFHASFSDFKLFPNPVSAGQLALSFTLETDERISISLLDIQGRLLGTLTSSESFTAGSHSVNYKLPALANGYYQLQLSTETGQQSIPLVVSQ